MKRREERVGIMGPDVERSDRIEDPEDDSPQGMPQGMPKAGSTASLYELTATHSSRCIDCY